MKIGLTLGKFAPLHRGHQHVIETALEEVDHLIVLIYDVPDITAIPLPVRAAWIRKLYPQVELLESWDGPLQVGDTPEITALHDAYLKQRLQGHRITHFYSSEFYGRHVSQALNAVDRRVDDGRVSVPISATQIRESPFAFREMLSDIVYRDHLIHAVFLGAPSTGKSTLAEAVAAHYKSAWVPEYGREYWEKHQVNRRLTSDQLVEITVGHRQREDEALKSADRYLLVDTDASTTRNFALHYHDRCDSRLDAFVAETRLRYDVFFLCLPDFPHADTWDRSGDVFREAFQRRTEADLKARRIPYHPIGGTIEDRVRQVVSILDNTVKYQSVV